MSVLLVMIPITFLIAGGFVWAFVRAARRGAFDDLDAPPMRAVFDEDEQVPEPSKSSLPADALCPAARAGGAHR